MLPDPNLSLTLPSLHDGTTLHCRVYLPPSVLAVASTEPDTKEAYDQDASPKWRGHAAVVAHPYAPMGGSYNDHIVQLVAHLLLKRTGGQQFAVATFNFRGVGRRAGVGRTSWTAKPETGDYMTVVGFLYYFVHFLDPYGDKEAAAMAAKTAMAGDKGTVPRSLSGAASRTASGTSTPTKAALAVPAADPPDAPILLCAGYSYGALVTRLLPPLADILAPLVAPAVDTVAAEVRRRAARAAAMQNADFAAVRAARAEAAAAAAAEAAAEAAAAAALTITPTPTPKSPSKTAARRSEARINLGVRVGGDDSQWRRRSHEFQRRSQDVVRPRRSQDLARRSLTVPLPGGVVAGGGSGGDRRSHRSRSRETFRQGAGEDPPRPSMSSIAERVHRGQRSASSRRSEDREAAAVAVAVAEADKAAPASASPTTPKTLRKIPNLPVVRPAYLLVSPPVGIVTHLATVFTTSAGFFRRRKTSSGHFSGGTVSGSGSGSGSGGDANDVVAGGITSAGLTATALPGPDSDADAKLAAHPTLAVYGDADVFVTKRKMRHWAERLTAASAAVLARRLSAVDTTTMTFTGSDGHDPDKAKAQAQAQEPRRLFRVVEVPTAGHFWIEGRTLYELEAAVDAFAAELVSGSEDAEAARDGQDKDKATRDADTATATATQAATVPDTVEEHA